MTPFYFLRHKVKFIPFITAILALLNSSAIDAARAETTVLQKSVSVDQPARKKLILCLGGGGTRGAAQIGVLREMEENNIKIDAIVGTSIGAIIGGLYCAGLTPDQIEDMLLSKALIRSYLTVPVVFRLVVAPIMYVPHVFGHHPYDGLYHGNKFANYINKQAASLPVNKNNPDLNIEDFPIKFEAVACDLLAAEPVTIAKGNLGRAVQASSAVPFLRRPVAMTRKDFTRLPGAKDDDIKDTYLLVDGGPQANLPILPGRALADHMGGAVLLAVDVYGNFTRFTPDHFRKIGSTAERSLEIILSSVEKKDLEKADLVINPDVSGINLLSTSVPEGLKAMHAGEEATAGAIPKLTQLLEQH